MNIKEIIKKTNCFELICADYDKDYRFCSTLDYACFLKEDYIYIPMIEKNENIFEQIKLHLKNPYCKGFFLNRSILDKSENQSDYHAIMKKSSSKIEVLILSANVFNCAYAICKENVEKYKPQIVTVAGSEEKPVLVDLTAYILSKRGTTLASINTSGPWQKLFEPLLLINDKIKHCVLDIDAAKNNVSKTAAQICDNNTVIFSKTSINHRNHYKDTQDYLEEITSILNYPKNLKNVFTFEENDLINSNLGQLECLNIVEEARIKTTNEYMSFFKEPYVKIKYKNLKLKTRNLAYYMPRCAVMAAMCAKSLNIKDSVISKCLITFFDTSGLYNENKLDNNNYSVLCTNEHTYFSIKNSIKSFCKKYDKFKKILIISAITGLDEYFYPIHSDIIKLAAKCKFDIAVLIDMNNFGAQYKTLDKNILIRKINSKNNKLNEEDLIKLGLFLKGEVIKDKAILVCTKESLNLKFLF